MGKQKIGITLSDETVKSLEFLSEKLGLKKSQAIAFSINTVAVEKYGFVREKEDDKKGERVEK